MPFRKILAALILTLLLPGFSCAQNSLFDDTRLSKIHITIPPDSLQRIYDSVLSDHYFSARFIFDDNSVRDTLENIGFRLRGNTSRYSKKKSFKISFSEYVPGRKYQGVKKINLNGEHNDPTMIREKLFYDLWKKAGMVERRTTFVKLYINGNYYGLYTNLEEMEKEWLTRVYPDNDGNLYKCTYPANLVYLGSSQQVYKNLENGTATGGRVYDLQTNKTEDDYSRLVELITELSRIPNDQFAASIVNILDVNGFLKALALDVATGNWDDYSYNKNNYYLYDDPDELKFRFITYDPDNTFGVDWFGIDWSVRDCRNWIRQNTQLPLAQKLLAVPAFYSNYKLFLDTIARVIIHPDSVFPRIDQMKQLIYQAAVDDTYRTLDYGYTVGDFNDGFIKAVDDHTPIGLKPFLERRQNTILAQLNASGTGESAVAEFLLAVFPNPATEEIRFIAAPGTGRPSTGRIYNADGKMVMEFRVPEGTTGVVTVPVTALNPGMYLLRLESAGKFRQAKFIRH